MDLIDRKALLERMRENASFATSYKPYMTKEEIAFRVLKDAKEQALRFVEDAPTIEAVPVVHGEWLIKEDEACFATWDYCSVCGFEMGFAGSSHYANFCPNCGADMRKEKKHETD